MTLLDTDHMTVLSFEEDSRFARLAARLRAEAGERFAVTVITLEEQARGWLAEIRRFRVVQRQVGAYDHLATLFRFYAKWEVVRFDQRAAEEFDRQRKGKVRIATQDLKIASIALVNGARLLTANLRDFRQVSDLRVEDWLN
jgi:tRNA(fMet)-specific endonuclease VapC